MKASEILKKEITYRWAEEIVKEIEDDTILILKYDIVMNAWIDEINKLIPSIKIKNACTRLTCPKTCMVCVEIINLIKSSESPLCINCKSMKLLYVKVKNIRCYPIKNLTIDKGVMCFIEQLDDVNIVDANENKVFLPQELYEFIKKIDSEYMNPVLIVRMLKYLEYEKSQRKTNMCMGEIIHGLTVSFLIDPAIIETTRMNLYRQNNIDRQKELK
ncbi:hypothetical protein NEAUS06_1470 [Nematocida ausubeli]|nr:hypothetical protein NEAUS06_1470 [Nematocida ausubeli]